MLYFSNEDIEAIVKEHDIELHSSIMMQKEDFALKED